MCQNNATFVVQNGALYKWQLEYGETWNKNIQLKQQIKEKATQIEKHFAATANRKTTICQMD